jgi:hypothetical protein
VVVVVVELRKHQVQLAAIQFLAQLHQQVAVVVRVVDNQPIAMVAQAVQAAVRLVLQALLVREQQIRVMRAV